MKVFDYEDIRLIPNKCIFQIERNAMIQIGFIVTHLSPRIKIVYNAA